MIFYRVLRWAGAAVVRLLIRVRVRGAENVPAEGPCIIAANHIHALDPVFLAIAIKRPICFMAKEEIMHWPVLGWLVRRLGAFPVKRGKVDVQAIRHSLAVLSRGGALGIFPEGTRSRTGDIQEALGGAVLLSARANATLVPVALAGDYRFGGRVRVNVGGAINIESNITGKPTSEERAAGTRSLMQQIAELKRQCDEESW